MVKFNVKNFAIISFLGIFLMGVVGIVYARQALPQGGDSFETAVKLRAGSYQGGVLGEREVRYFYLEGIRPGQEIKIKGSFTAAWIGGAIANLGLYDQNRTRVVENSELIDRATPITISWLPNADRSLYKYYLKISSDGGEMSSHSLTISLTNRYDAGSQTDAGDVFERAMNITTGNHAAYLSGASGTDTKDFYRVGIKKDETLTVRITPPSKASLTLKIYNSNRQVLQEVFAANPGAIVQTAFRATTSEDLFVEVSCDGWCSANLVNYTLNVAIQPLLRTVPPGRGTI